MAASSSGCGGVGGGQRQPQLGVREHVRAVGERDRQRAALLDEQDRDAVLADAAERLEQRLDDGRREPERRLVEQQHVGPREQRTRDRELLLLAARERAGVALRELGDDREEAAHPVEVVGDALLAAPPGEPEAQVLLDGERAEDVAALRARARRRRGRRPRARPRSATPVEQDLAARRAARRP